MNTLERVTIVGAGLMGHGIAQVFASHGHPVWLVDANQDVLAAAPQRIRTNLSLLAAHGIGDEASSENIVQRIALTRDLTEACVDAEVVIEAVSENMALKQSIFVSHTKV